MLSAAFDRASHPEKLPSAPAPQSHTPSQIRPVEDDDDYAVMRKKYPKMMPWHHPKRI